MQEKIGPVTMIGTQAELDMMRAFVTTATTLLGTRIDPFTLETREREQMPIAFVKKNGDIVYARGHWSSRKRRMLCSKDLLVAALDLLRDKTLGHEFVHVLFSDWLGKWHRKQLLPLITPEADDWNDMTISDTWEGYVADPSEALACYGSAALFGWAKPAYSTLYTRRILQSDYPKAKTLLLATAP